MRSLIGWSLPVVLLAGLALAAEGPDGSTFEHPVLGVDGPRHIRVRFCGLPVKVQLADLQFKGEYSEKEAEALLKSTLGSGSTVKLVLDAEKPGDGSALPQAHVFKGSTHVNLELVKRGFAISDGGNKKFASVLQKAQMEAMSKKAGLWGKETAVAAAETKPAAKPETPAATPPPPSAVALEVAPADYAGPVVADLQGKEYHLPGSRYAKSIRVGARIEYPSPTAAEKAGKLPSPFSFPDRSKAQQAQAVASKGSAAPDQVVKDAQAALKDALVAMQEARKFHGTDHKKANANWQKAAKILADNLDRLTPVADANPNNQDLQKLTEEMSMNLYSCNKYQSL